MPASWRFEARTGSCDVVVGAPLAEASALHPALIITDPTVHRLHGGQFPRAPVVEVPEGEEHKTLATVERVYQALLSAGVARDGLVLAIGGGLVCDVAGFAAATWMRGVPFAVAPTTLLAQADAGVGGKTAVNFRGLKNLVGAFRQPRACLCDPAVLATLPERAYRSGLAEIVKHAALAEPELFTWLEERAAALGGRDAAAVEHAVCRSLRIKLAIVARDELESGDRMLLNFGHTVGHAIEALQGVPHGEAVSCGMVAVAQLSVRRGLLPTSSAERLRALLARFGLPTRVTLSPEAAFEAVAQDKKRRGEGVRMVLLAELGRPRLVDVPLAELREVLRDLR